jgi:sugar O-acyltransferase (sialic acid O-acetyltransferase NeuD family)
MTMPVIIVGAGGHARVLVDALRTAGRPILGVVDPKLTTDAAGPLGLKVLGGDEALGQYCADKIELVNGIGGTGSTERRHDVFAQFCARGFRFSSVVHRSAVVSEFAELGQGVQVMAGCVIQCGAIIGANTIINTNASIDHNWRPQPYRNRSLRHSRDKNRTEMPCCRWRRGLSRSCGRPKAGEAG